MGLKKKKGARREREEQVCDVVAKDMRRDRREKEEEVVGRKEKGEQK